MHVLVLLWVDIVVRKDDIEAIDIEPHRLNKRTGCLQMDCGDVFDRFDQFRCADCARGQ